MKVTVYTKPDCVQCEYTKKLLNEQGTEFEEKDVTTDADAAGLVRQMGYTQLPVVVVRNKTRLDHWSGFKIDRLKGLKKTGDY